MSFATAGMIGANDQQPGELALRTRIGLQRNPGKAGDLSQPFLELLKNDLVTARLAQWRKGMNAGQFGPGQRQQFRRRIRSEERRVGKECRSQWAVNYRKMDE